MRAAKRQKRMLRFVSIKLAEDLYTGRPSADYGFGDPDKKTMLEGAGNGGKPFSQFVRAENGAEKTIQDKIPIIADEWFSTRRQAQAEFALAIASLCRCQNHPPGHFKAENIDFYGQGKFPQHGHGF